ncbi:hypothetical protein TIFTF001_023888 [Ficus carica]|uniref:guanylate kinase n=1 Tax=Ficus carica TaxID=3494 RepID=A0AA88AV99_FICCA|nr:hypothetical protein TIFTF001_023888 [Ficus carica]
MYSHHFLHNLYCTGNFDFRNIDISISMGEAPAFILDDFKKALPNGFDLKSNGCETTSTTIVVANKTYLIGGISTEVYPTVLGTTPKLGKGFSAVLLNEDRILIIKKGSTPDDFAWFLEVDTHHVRQQKKVLGTEVVAWSKGVRGNVKKPIVISGPSGVGKGTLISMLMEEFPSMFGFSVSHTTRAPRNMEQDGIHYHFTDKSVMEKEIKDGKFLEFASVHGNLYGTSVEAVEVVADDGKRCILDIDVQGARSVRASSLEAIFVFICPPSMDELEKRLRARGTETEEQVLKRLRNAEAEIEQGKSLGIFDHILYNDDLKECYKSLKKILGLDESTNAATETAPKWVDLPVDHSISKIDQKIIISSRTPELKKGSKDLIVLDLLSLKGGAPGRTRGLEIYAMNPFLDGLNGINKLS